ncbi:MAG TPA: M23 family metallopeptidase [Gemmatimonadales bacterium]|nr:M23 family metallopeptidase [Gemmatimonadales bacterium]
MPPLPSYLLALAVSLGSAGVAAAQSGVGRPDLTWRPSVPLQGSLVLLVVLSDGTDSVDAVQGELAGEPLHFERAADGFRAVGGVPLEAEASVPARVVIERAGGTSDTMMVALPVGPRRAPRERLRTAPEFVQPPESLAERIRAERELLEEVRSRAHATPRLWSEPFVRPRAALVTSGFGAARVFNGVVRSRHFGVDFAGQRGAPVRAANRGVVAFVADLYYSGTAVYLDHGAGIVTGYLHLSRALVIPGDTVARGQLIGHVGASGRVTGPHLHWLAGYGGVTVDPLDLLRIENLRW